MKNLWLFIFSLSIVACSKKPLQNTTVKTPQQESINKSPDSITNPLSSIFLIEGTQAKSLGDIQKALQLYQNAINIDPNNDAAYYEIAALYQTEQLLNINSALENIEKAVAIDPNNLLYQEILGQLYIDNQQYKQGIDVFKRLTANDTENLSYQFRLAKAYNETQQYDEALKIYNSIEEVYGFNPEINFERHLIYFSQGEQAKAINELKLIVDQNPQYVSYSSFIAEYYLKNQNYDDALKYAQSILSQEPNNAAAYAIALQVLAEQNKKEAFVSELASVTQSDISIDDKIRLFYPLIELQGAKPDWQRNIHSAVKSLSEKHPDNAESFALYGDVLYNSGNYEEAIPAYKKSITIRNDVYPVWDQIINHYIYQSDYESLAPFAEAAISVFPDLPFPAYISGYAYFVTRDYNKAISILKTAANHNYQDKSYEVDVLSLLADAYHETKQYDTAYLTYDKVLLKEPDNAHVLNNYSYYLADRKVNLDKAEKMAARANALNPDDPNTLDTYGWVLFQSGQYEKAVTFLSQAASKINDSANVFEHYGDALFKTGKRLKAIEQWQKALSLDSKNIRLKEKIDAAVLQPQ